MAEAIDVFGDNQTDADWLETLSEIGGSEPMDLIESDEELVTLSEFERRERNELPPRQKMPQIRPTGESRVLRPRMEEAKGAPRIQNWLDALPTTVDRRSREKSIVGHKDRVISAQRSPEHNQRRRERAWVKPPKFEGKDACVESHLTQFEIVARRNNWDELEKADYLKCSLSGEANHILRDLKSTATYEEVADRLRRRYGSVDQMEACRVELKTRIRRPGESLSQLMKDVRRLFLQAYPSPSNEFSEIMARDAFINALQDRELILKVLEREPTTLEQALKIAERMELYRSLPIGIESDSKSKLPAIVRGTAATEDNLLQMLVENQTKMQQQITMLSETLQKCRLPTGDVAEASKLPVNRGKGNCHYCNKPGHYRPECPDRLKAMADKEASAKATTRSVSSGESWSRQGSLELLYLAGEDREDDDFDKLGKYKPAEGMIGDRSHCENSMPVLNSSTMPVLDSTSTMPGLDSAAMPVLNSSTMPVLDSTAMPGLDSSTMPVLDSTAMPGLDSSAMPSLDSSTMPASDSAAMPQERSALPVSYSVNIKEADIRGHMESSAWSNNDNEMKTESLIKGKTRKPIQVSNVGQSLYIELKINNRRCKVLLDTGSEVTLIPASMVDVSQVQPSGRTLRAANGTIINLLGEWKTVVKLGSLLSPVTFLVSDQVDEVLLGIDWMRAQRCLLSFDDLTLTLHGQCFPLLKRMAVNRCHRLILQEEVRLPGNCEIITKGKILYANLRQSNPETWLTETGECVPGVRTARGLVENKDGRDLPVRILNTNREEVVLREGTNLCKLQEVMAISEGKVRSQVLIKRGRNRTLSRNMLTT